MGRNPRPFEFSNDTGKPGVIGRRLAHAERLALIEYIKALPEMPANVQPSVPLNYGQYMNP